MYDSFVSGWVTVADMGLSEGFGNQYHFDIVSIRFWYWQILALLS